MTSSRKRRGRFAPSPTGPLHLGNLRTALLTWLHARQTGATLVLRVEDIDGPRCDTRWTDQILEDLRWLGLDWDEGPYVQSQRSAIYQDALDLLIAADLAYPCWCSRKEIAEASSAPHGATPVYPGTCRSLSSAERAQRQSERPDRTPSWRFRIDGDPDILVMDGILGELRQHVGSQVGDFVLKRADGLWAYQHAVVVDDLLMGVTDIVRGQDLAESAPRQVVLWQALAPLLNTDLDAPKFWHVPLWMDATGHRMSKRDGSASLDELRATHAPSDVLGMLAHSLGWTPANTPISLAELTALQRMPWAG